MESDSLLDIFREKDPGVAQRLQTRIEQQDQWNDVFSTKLIEILDKIDVIRAETSKRLRRAEELTVAEDALLAAASECNQLCERQRQAALAHESAMSDLHAARHLLSNADSTREEASALRDASLKADTYSGLLSDASENVARCAARYDSAMALLIESHAQQENARERLELRERHVQNVSEKLAQAEVEYQRAAVQTRGNAAQLATMLQTAESVQQMARAAQRDLVGAHLEMGQAQKACQGAYEMHISATELAGRSREILISAAQSLETAERRSVAANDALKQATDLEVAAEQKLNVAANSLANAEAEQTSARNALRCAKQLSYVTVIVCIVLLLVALGISHHRVFPSSLSKDTKGPVSAGEVKR